MIDFTKNQNKLKNFTENNRTFSLRNPSQKYFGYVKGETTAEAPGQKRCDYIICFNFGSENNRPSNYLFIELKGSDNKKALEQVISTIQYFLNNGLTKNNCVNCFIVSGSCPSVTTRDQILKAKFPYGKHPYNFTLTFKTRHAEYEIK